MREIKFRAYNKVSKIMYWFDLMWGNCHAMGGGWIGMLPIGEERKYQMHGDNRMAIDPMDCEIVQFTGLVDKNGREIYEGDIIKDGHGSYGEIIWHQESMSFKIEVKKGWQHPLYDGFEKETIEIIGNIYENPELLNA